MDEDLRIAPLLARLGVPVVEEVEEVGVRRRPPEYICWGYCWFMADWVGEGAVGKIPEEVVRVRECPDWASKGRFTGGRTEMAGFAMGLRRTGRGGCWEGAMVAMVDDSHSLVRVGRVKRRSRADVKECRVFQTKIKT